MEFKNVLVFEEMWVMDAEGKGEMWGNVRRDDAGDGKLEGWSIGPLWDGLEAG